jgi:hypothetical protein
MQLVAAAALVALPSSVQVVCRKLETPPQRLSPAAVRSLGALERASRPADAVLVHPGHEGVPPPVLIGRRVVYARFLPETAWLAARESRKGALERATAFFETRDPGAARRIARELRASFVCLYEGERLGFAESEGLATVFEERGVRVYRLP